MSGQHRRGRFLFMKKTSDENEAMRGFRAREKSNLKLRRKIEKLEPSTTTVGKHGELSGRRNKEGE